MRTARRGESGAALLIVLLFMALAAILITTMLSVAGNESVISGLHRNSAQAFEFAQSGLEEAFRRMEGAHKWFPGFTGSLDAASLDQPCPPQTTVSVQLVGDPGGGTALYEVQSDVTLTPVIRCRAARRLSQLVLVTNAAGAGLPPDIVFGFNLATQGSASITGGDVYGWTFVKYKNFPTQPTGTPSWALSNTYAGWAVCKTNCDGTGGGVAWCFTPGSCGGPSDTARWYPGSRRAIRLGTEFDVSVSTTDDPSTTANEAFTSTDDRDTSVLTAMTCSTPGPVGSTTIRDRPDYVDGDKMQTNVPVPADEKLYGCDPDLLPYTYIRQEFVDGEGVRQKVWFKTILFDSWFSKYFILDQNPADDYITNPDGTKTKTQTCCAGDYRKRVGAEAGGESLYEHPERGAIPPYPKFADLEAGLNADALEDLHQYMSDKDATINASTTLQLGCYAAAMTCPGNRNDYRIVWLDNPPPYDTPAEYRINANLRGHGTLLVDGDLTVNGTFEYWGTLVINGKLKLGNGTVTIHGGLIAQETVELNGNITVEAGIFPNVGSAPLGELAIIKRSWWERKD